MAKSQSGLTPKEQQQLFDLLKKSGAQQTSGGMDQSTPDPAAQQGTGNVDSNSVAQLFNQPSTLQAQPGDQMHPMDAIAHITNQLQQSQNTNTNTYAPKLVVDKGQLNTQVPRTTALGRLLFKTKNEPLKDPTNYYNTLVGLMGQQGADKVLPGNISTDPQGNKFVSSDQFGEIVKAKSLLPSSNNPPVSLQDALTGNIINQSQYDKYTSQGLKPTDTKNLNEWRLGVLGRTASTREGQLGLANNKFEATLGQQFQKGISDAEQRTGTPMGLAATKLQNSMLARQSLANRYNPDTDTYDLNPTEFGDLAIAAAKSLNSTGVLSNEQIDAIKQASIKGDFGRLATYLTGVNFGGSTQDIIRRLVSLVDREGLASEQARNLYAQQNMPAFDALKKLNAPYYDNILNKAFGGVSYSQLLADSKDTQSPNYIAPTIVPLQKTPAPVNGVVPPPIQPVTTTPTQPSKATKTPVRKSLPGLIIH